MNYMDEIYEKRDSELKKIEPSSKQKNVFSKFIEEMEKNLRVKDLEYVKIFAEEAENIIRFQVIRNDVRSFADFDEYGDVMIGHRYPEEELDYTTSYAFENLELRKLVNEFFKK